MLFSWVKYCNSYYILVGSFLNFLILSYPSCKSCHVLAHADIFRTSSIIHFTSITSPIISASYFWIFSAGQISRWNSWSTILQMKCWRGITSFSLIHSHPSRKLEDSPLRVKATWPERKRKFLWLLHQTLRLSFVTCLAEFVRTIFLFLSIGRV